MEKYKCISCGEMKESEGPCSCPMCGYKMFKMPYDRKTILAKEIKGFMSRLEKKSVDRKDLIFSGKDKDDARFPHYDKIRKYVTGTTRVEDFQRNLLETAEQLKRHFSETFSNTYPVSFQSLGEDMARCDEVLLAAAQILVPQATPVLHTVEWEDVSLLYAETPNESLWGSVSGLIDLIKRLSIKIVRVIKINNLYGTGHKYTPGKNDDVYAKNADYPKLFVEAISKTENLIKKKYVIDITDDGSDELKEMLTCLWNDIELIMHAPLFIKSYRYQTKDGETSEEDWLRYASEKVQARYIDYNQTVKLDGLLGKETEDGLFEIYRKLIEVDTIGILVPTGTRFINVGASEKELEKLIGLSGIKESVKKIKAYARSNKGKEALNIHMCFLGNPGTGKTEVARLIADILYENKILPTNNVVEVDRSGLVSQYFGATAEKTRRVIAEAMGGVLFVDEAYALGNNASSETDYGKEAIDTLVKAMEDYRGRFCVILAGYKNEMLKMLSTNPGFRSRIQFTLDFPNYSRDELRQITELMLQKRQYTIGEAAMNRMLDITDVKRKEPNFANAREIRNILDQVTMCQNLRCVGTEDSELGIVDVNKYIQDAKINLPTSDDGQKKILTGEEELDQLIGLSAIKRMVKKIKAYAKRNQGQEGINLHMCFYGNPGTGKTEVARILSRILYDAGVLPEAKLVETDSHGLIGQYVGETAPKTQAKIEDAMNGVLFIDEAYGLVSSSTVGSMTSYGEEAIAVLLKEMEDRRGQFCVILAGYKDEMKTMLSINPGLQSRIQFTLDFPDYTREELGQIAAAFLAKRKYEIDGDALSKLLDVTEYYRNRPNFANARTVRNILDQVILNQNLRTEDTDDDTRIVLEDVEDYLMDEGIDLTKPGNSSPRIGFIS